jgi:hypothetical protein
MGETIMKLIFSVLAIVASLSLTTMPTKAAEPSDTPQGTIATFFSLLEEGKTTEAVSDLMAPKVLEMMGAQIHSTIGQLEGWSRNFGKYQGYEMMFTEGIAERLEHHVYIVYYEGLPVTYSFFLYEQSGKWLITTFKFNTEYQNIGRYMS